MKPSVPPSKFFPLFLESTRSTYDLRNTISIPSLIFLNIFFFSNFTRVDIIVDQDSFLIRKNLTLTIGRIFMLFPISLFIDFNERENRNPIAIPFPPRRKTRHLRVAHREDNPKDRGVEEGKRISKLLGRTFSDACALSLPALPLSQIAINR